jgi:hypothetical protein
MIVTTERRAQPCGTFSIEATGTCVARSLVRVSRLCDLCGLMMTVNRRARSRLLAA